MPILPDSYTFSISDSYHINLALVKTPKLQIYSFNMLGQTEWNCICALRMAEKIMEQKFSDNIDAMVAIEAKSLGFMQELSRILGFKRYIVIRKTKKVYMQNEQFVTVKSRTTEDEQTLFLDGKDLDFLRNKRILLVDDVISTGNSIEGAKKLIEQSNIGATVAHIACVATQGSTLIDNPRDYIRLGHLPIFDGDGNPM
ncbi:hypothetical protein LJB89_01040 [Tyzzerella sp. OttesenSCG-928-J15]|nr:hypothetical protein [Tyzzerella sp. OttesenSCG-928-J15]